LEVGKIVGKIPFPFDPNFDSFMVSGREQGSSEQGGRNLFLYFLTIDDYVSAGSIKSLPYLCLPRNTRIRDVLWSSDDIITVLTDSIEKGGMKTTVFRLSLTLGEQALSFKQIPVEGINRLSLSDNQKYVAVLKNEAVLIKDYATWKDLFSYPHTGPIDALWKSGTECIITGTYITEVLDIERKTGRLVCISQPEGYGYAENGTVQIKSRGKAYEVGAAGGLSAVSSFAAREAATASSSYRVYLETLPSGGYQNLIMVRNISGYGTKPLHLSGRPTMPSRKRTNLWTS
jgi:hypothetical protein